MTEVIEACILCNGGVVKRIPSLSFSVSKSTGAGSLVRDFISDAKKDVEAEKQKLKEEYND
tara:strand:- start:162 stop:344 length:183 start_codon:yes stop_codon:yes gene_type:complete